MTRRVHIAFLVIAVLTLAIRAQVPPPAPPAVFRSGTDLVQVDVSVLDGKRRPVRGLTAADFTVLEDGQQREVQAFTEVYLPDRVQSGDAAWMRQVPSDVATNAVAQQQGRLVVLLMDRSIPPGEPTITARRIATRIIDELGPGDLAAIVSTSNSGVQNLTADRSRLLRALTHGDLSTDISDEAKEIEARVFALTGRTWSALNDPRCTCGLCVLETITRVADAVQSSSRRKLLFFIGSDLLLQAAGSADGASQDVGCERRLQEARETMFTALDRANLTVHSLDALGLANTNPITRASSTLGAGGAAGRANASAAMSNLQRQGNLQVLPARTGGRAVLNTNGPETAVPAIFHESDSYYLIGFRPGEASRDGKFHRISVKTTRRGLDVRARSGYSVSAASPPAASSSDGDAITASLRDALMGLLPATTSPVALSAAAFGGSESGRAAVVLTVRLDVDAFASTSASNGLIEIVAGAFDGGGQQKGLARHTVAVPTANMQAASRGQFDAQSRLDLPPGDYEIRVAVSGAKGPASAFTYVTVPPFATVPLSLSNIVVAERSPSLAVGVEVLSPVLSVVPTARRTFGPADRLVALLRIYQGTGRQDPLANVEIRTSIADGVGKIVAASVNTMEAQQFAKERSADRFVALPVDSLPPGDYLLSVQASMGPRTAGRVMRFEVQR